MSIITDLIEAHVDMALAYRSGTLLAFRKQNETAERVNQLTDIAEEEFASQNGWKIAKSPFAPEQIGKKRNITSNRYTPIQSWLDHPVFYRTHGSTAAAIVSQPYGTLDQYRDELDAIALRIGLKWCVPTNERDQLLVSRKNPIHHSGETRAFNHMVPGATGNSRPRYV